MWSTWFIFRVDSSEGGKTQRVHTGQWSGVSAQLLVSQAAGVPDAASHFLDSDSLGNSSPWVLLRGHLSFGILRGMCPSPQPQVTPCP